MRVNKPIIRLAAITAWMLFVLVGYYYFHKPVSPAALAAPLTALFDVLLMTAVLALAGGIGARLLKAANFSPLERITLHAALGLGTVSLIWMALGWLHLFTSWAAWLLLGTGLVLLRREALEWLKNLSAVGETFCRSARLERIIAILCLVLVGYQLLVALAPPVGWDALTYHLQLPRLYLEAGYLYHVPENMYSGHFQLAEMIYTLAMALHRPETAGVLGWAAGILVLPGLMGAVRRLVGTANSEARGISAGWVAVFALLAGETFRVLLGFSATDQFSALFGSAVLILLIEWMQTRQVRWFYLACLFSGFAIAVKLTGGVLLAGIILVALFYARRERLRFSKIVLGVLIALLPVLPWLIKNGIATGNPIFPYSIETTFFQVNPLASSTALNGNGDWLERIFLPVSLTWVGYDKGGLFGTDIGPLILLLALPGAVALWHDHRIRAAVLALIPAGLALFGGGFFASHLQQPRLYFSVLAFSGLLAGVGWDWLQSKVLVGVRVRRLMGAAILLVGGLILISDTISLTASNPLGVALGVNSKENYRLTNLGYHELAMRSIHDLPSNSRVLMLWEPKAFYAPLTTEPDTWIIRFKTDWQRLKSADRVLDDWRTRGYTHVLVYQAGVELVQATDPDYTPEIWQGLQETLARLKLVESLDNIYLLYELP
ncbi:MAG: glycosyltransferase family 39 protein [Bellilinea sp.]